MDARQARDHGRRRRDGASHRRARLVLLAALIGLLAVGCGSESNDSGDGGGADTGAGEAPTGTELTITVWLQGRDGPSQEVTLTCDPPGGTHPRPEEACTVLEADAEALKPLPPDSVCTQIYGGPEEAEIVGTLDGREVHATFSRQNGCEIDRWTRMLGILQLGD